MNKLNLLILLWEKLLKKKNKKQLKIKGKNDALVVLKTKEIKPRETKPNEYGYYFLYGLGKIRKSYESVDFFDLDYNFKDLRIPSLSFSNFKGPVHIFKSIYNGDITLEDVKKSK